MITCIWILSGCGTEPAISYHILHIEGVTWACNVSTSYVSFGSVTETEESGKVSLPVSDGDLLYIFNEDDLELYYRYRSKDGHFLKISFDTLNAKSAHVNGSLAFLQITEDPSSWAKFEALTSSEVNQLSALYISTVLNHEILDVLSVHESSLPGTGLVLENSAGGDVFTELLSICRPEWMGLYGGADMSEVDHDNFLALLWISDDIHVVSNLLHCCTDLESMIITDWEPSKGELVPLGGLKNLHSLTLADCYLTDLSNLEFPPSLVRLHLIGCDTLTDISELNQISNLQSLNLTGSDHVESLEAINIPETLKWISFPSNTTQEVFRSILATHEKLEVVELINCPLVSDFLPLRDQTNLKALILNVEECDWSQISELDQTELIILSSTIFEDSPELISQLRANLPHTDIVPGSGLCLGSGWLLLLLPLVLFTRIMLRSNVIITND